MQAHRQTTSKHLNAGFSGNETMAIMPVVATFYALLVFPFLSNDGASPIVNHTVWPLMAGTAIVILYNNKSAIDRKLIFSLPILSLMAYFFWALASVSWAHSPDYAFSRATLQILIAITIVAPYALPIPAKRIIPGLQVCYAAALAVNVGYVLTTKPSPIGHPGYFSHKQELGMFCATAFILFLLVYVPCDRGQCD